MVCVCVGVCHSFVSFLLLMKDVYLADLASADIHELTSILAESPQVSNTVRPSKAMAMFASRACRSAIMIGRPLTRSRMQTVLRGLADLDQPWNCPHGRPTLRHLVDLRQVLRHAEGDDEAAAGQAAQSAMEEG